MGYFCAYAHTHTHTHTHTRDGGGLEGFLAKLLVPGNTPGPRAHFVLVPPQASVPSPSPPSRLPSMGVPLPVTRPRPTGPPPACSHPTPVGYPWKAWLCLHLSSSPWQWLLSPCPCSGPQPCGMGPVSQTAASPAWASGLEMGPLTAQGACRANRSFQPWKVGPPC